MDKYGRDIDAFVRKLGDLLVEFEHPGEGGCTNDVGCEFSVEDYNEDGSDRPFDNCLRTFTFDGEKMIETTPEGSFNSIHE